MEKVLKVLSTIVLVFAVIYIIAGILAIVDSTQFGDLAASMDSSLEATDVAILSKAAGIIAIIVGCLNLLVGCLGFRGANGAKRSLTVAIVLVLLSLALTIYGMIGAALTWQSIGNLVFPAAFLVTAICTRRKLA